ncbi:MAG: hypothetical protein JO148_00390, partial [Acidimicrobiia bacterium]|nr:hypothetical protein [Acidimicrobiia bacterium]
MRAVVPPVSTWPAPGVARPLDGAVVAVVPDGAVVAGDVTGVVVAGVVGVVVAAAAVVGVAVVGVAVVAGVVPPPIGGWVSGTVACVVAVVEVPPGVLVDVLIGTGVVVGGAAVVVFVLLSPLRATTVATPAPKTPRIKTISAMVRSRLRCCLRSGRGTG